MKDLTGQAKYLLSRRSIESNGCWTWNLSVTDSGYAQANIRENGRQRKWFVHVLSYMTFVGPVPDGYEVDHLCNNPRCINPEHLEAKTQYENNLRALQRKWGPLWSASTCHKGHPRTKRRADRAAYYCVTCDSDNQKRRRRARSSL